MNEIRKTAVIFGLANKRSIAWAIAQKLQRGGLAAGHHLSERAAGAGGQGSDDGVARRGWIHVRCVAGRANREAF